MLLSAYTKDLIEAGVDEVGRGCLAGPVVAAAVILPKGYKNGQLNDSKKLSEKLRNELREKIENDAVCYNVAFVDNDKIDEINILNASFLAMHIALENLSTNPEFILVDGNKFKPYKDIPHECFVKGDGKFLSIAAASILAKVYRDEYMKELHKEFPFYDWINNVGYPTPKHKAAIREHGITSYHRKSFNVNEQLKFGFPS